MANIFVYGSVGIAADAMPNRRAPNLKHEFCAYRKKTNVSQTIGTYRPNQQLRQLF